MTLYTVIYSDKAYEDLVSIYRYIAEELQAPMSARGQTLRIRDAIEGLSAFPQKHEVVAYAKWKTLGLRQMPVDRYVIFYLVHEESASVQIVRIFYGGRNLKKQLEADT